MSNIQLTAKFAIKDGKIEEAKKIARTCMAIVKEKEEGKGLLQYDWFFSSDEKECHVRETYKDSDAVMVHMGNLGEALGQLLQISTLTGEVYGKLSAEVEETLKGLDVKFYSFYQGL